MSIGKINNTEGAANYLGILGHPTRLIILDELTRSSKLSVSEVTKLVNESQPLVSYHLLLLKSSGLINANKKGRTIYYSISDAATKELIKRILNLLGL